MALLGTNSSLYGAGNQKITDDQIRQFISGASSPDQIFQAAQKHGVSTQQIANAMQGTPYTQSALDRYVQGQQATGPNQSATTGLLNTPFKHPDKKPAGYLDSRANALYGSGNQNISSADIQNFINQGKTPDQIFNEAIKRGISADQIAHAMQGTPYTSEAIDRYIKNQGVTRETADPVAQVDNTIIPEFRPAQYSAAVRDPTLGTVAGNLEQVLDPNSPLMQRSAAMGLQQANRRGLLNSSIGISSAQNAMVDAGLQIATPDAASHNQFALQNAETQNLMNRFNAEQGLKAGMFSSDLLAQQDRFNVQQVNEMVNQQLGRQHAINLEHLQQKYRAQIDGSANAARLYQQGMNEIGRILGNMELTPEAKQKQVAEMTELMHEALAINSAITNSGLAEWFGVKPGGGTTGSGTGDGAGSGTGDGAGSGTGGGAGSQTGTSTITNEPLGATGQGTFIIGSGDKLPEAAATALQEAYGVDPRHTLNLTGNDVMKMRYDALGIPFGNQPAAQMTPGEREELKAKVARYPTPEQIKAAIDAGQVSVLPLVDPQYGEFYHPAFSGITARELIHDPNNIFGLWA
jgi:hypothetical protein